MFAEMCRMLTDRRTCRHGGESAAEAKVMMMMMMMCGEASPD